MKKCRVIPFLLIVVFLISSAGPGWADKYPSKPIRYIITLMRPAAGSTMFWPRAFQKPFEKELGVRILIENISAGTTKVATLEAMKAKPDGYTLIHMSDPAWVAYYYSKTYDTKVGR